MSPGAGPPAAAGFTPPPYPYERLRELTARAVARFGSGGVVDCSIGTPGDPPPADVLAAVHREGEIVGEVLGEESTRIQVVLDDVGRSRFAEFVAS